MNTPLHPLGFKTEILSLEQMRNLIDALTTISHVTAGLQETGLFSAPAGYSEAGYMLEGLRCLIDGEIDTMRDIAKERLAPTRDDADAKFDIEIQRLLWAGERPATIVAKLATLSADLDWRLAGRMQP
jgi:hypothetical protein